MEGIVLIVIVVVGLAVALAVLFMYNRLVRQRLRVDEAWAQVQVELTRRHDLIPNLVDAVAGYMGYEQQVLTEVTEARARAVGAAERGPQERAAAEDQLSDSLRSLFAVMEAYPTLRADENVRSLQAQLTTTEDRISAVRDGYNGAVRAYDTAISTFPAVLMAGMMGFHARQFFTAEPEASQVPEVRLH